MAKTLQVFVRNFKANISVGVYPAEHNKPQPVRIDVEMDTSVNIDNVNEDLSKTISYEGIIDCIRNLEKSPHIQLIETIAQKIGAVCMQDSRVLKAKITIEKTTVFPETDGCGITLTITRD